MSTTQTTAPLWEDMTPRQFDTAAKDQPLTLFSAAEATGDDLFSLLAE